MGLLSVNRQVGSEAASIFYGANTFLFTTMSSVTPFLRDRVPEIRKLIRSIQLDLRIQRSDWHSVTTAYNRRDSWRKAFASIARLPFLILQNVCVHINDTEYDMYTRELGLGSGQLQWLYSLCKINNLDKLGLAYSYDQWGGANFTHIRRPLVNREVYSQTGEELWAFLAPRMLKAPGNSMNALLDRRIWDFEDDPETDVEFDGVDIRVDETDESDD